MKKKLFGIIMAICLMLMSVFPAMAADIEDPAVNKSYTAYVAIQEAINNKQIDDLRIATADFEAANSELSDEQKEELELLIGGEIYDVIFTAAIIIGTADAYEAYVNDNSMQNAIAFVDAYEMAVVDCKINMSEFVREIDTAYTNALDDVPSDDVLAVYNAWVALDEQLEWVFSELLEEALNELEAKQETLDDLSDEELTDLAKLMGEPSKDAAVAAIDGLVEDATILLEVAKAYENYDGVSKDSANELIEVYESIFNNPNFDDDGAIALIYQNYPDLDELYENAKVVIKNNEVIADLTIEDWTYGEPANLPTVTVKYGNDSVVYKYYKVIVNSDGDLVDISVEELDAAPTEVGFYAVKAFVPGTAEYNDWESEPVVFNIGRLSLAKANVVVTGVKDMTYTGKALTQDQMKITVNGEEVVIGKDVTVTYKDNINVGTATIEIGATIDSNYTEKHTVTFTIKAATTSPSTGDSSMLPVVASVPIFALIGVVIFRKRLMA